MSDQNIKLLLLRYLSRWCRMARERAGGNPHGCRVATLLRRHRDHVADTVIEAGEGMLSCPGPLKAGPRQVSGTLGHQHRRRADDSQGSDRHARCGVHARRSSVPSRGGPACGPAGNLPETWQLTLPFLSSSTSVDSWSCILPWRQRSASRFWPCSSWDQPVCAGLSSVSASRPVSLPAWVSRTGSRYWTRGWIPF